MPLTQLFGYRPVYLWPLNLLRRADIARKETIDKAIGETGKERRRQTMRG